MLKRAVATRLAGAVSAGAGGVGDGVTVGDGVGVGVRVGTGVGVGVRVGVGVGVGVGVEVATGVGVAVTNGDGVGVCVIVQFVPKPSVLWLGSQVEVRSSTRSTFTPAVSPIKVAV